MNLWQVGTNMRISLEPDLARCRLEQVNSYVPVLLEKPDVS
jgi:hypothetical protein